MREKEENIKGSVRNQEDTPLLSALHAFISSDPAYFRIPAHRFSQGVDPELEKLLGASVFCADLTEAEGLDDLHAPSGAILKAEQLAAELWGSEECHFLVNGSTCGNEAMLLTCVKPGEKVLIARNVHKSVLMGLILSGAVPVWLQPEDLPGWEMDGPVSSEQVERTLSDNPDCRAVMLVSPTYYGVCSPLDEIARVCHDRKIPLLVDEAHGTHLYFMENAPAGALSAGADLVVQSVHKTGGSMTQSSLLHVQGGLIDRVRLRESLAMVMSTSPSYVLMASLDGARHQLAVSGKELLKNASFLAEKCRKGLRGIRGIEVAENADADPLRIVFSARSCGISGFALQRSLYQLAGISLELSDPVYAVAVITWGNTERDIRRLVDAVQKVAEDISDTEDAGGYYEDVLSEERHCQFSPDVVCTPRDAWYDAKESCALEAACGKIAAESVIPYPPGVPVLYPGERITEGLLRRLCRFRDTHTPLHGPEDPTLHKIRVLNKTDI